MKFSKDVLVLYNALTYRVDVRVSTNSSISRCSHILTATRYKGGPCGCGAGRWDSRTRGQDAILPADEEDCGEPENHNEDSDNEITEEKVAQKGTDDVNTDVSRAANVKK